MADELLQARADVVVLHDDVEPAVSRLIEDGHLVGAITNGNFPFDRLALAAHFSFVVHAEQVGGPKPGPEPFAEAVRLTGGDPQRLGARRRRAAARHRRGAGVRDARGVAEPLRRGERAASTSRTPRSPRSTSYPESSPGFSGDSGTISTGQGAWRRTPPATLP